MPKPDAPDVFSWDFLKWPKLCGEKALENGETTSLKGSKTRKLAKGGSARQQPATKTRGSKIQKAKKDKPKGKQGQKGKVGSPSLLAKWMLYKDGEDNHGAQLLTEPESFVVGERVPEEEVEPGSQD